MGHITVFGSNRLGADVLSGLVAAGHEVDLVAPRGDQRAVERTRALGVEYIEKPDSAPLGAADFTRRPDLTVSAHSFRIIPDWVRNYARIGSIGYHPSLLPAFKGRNAVGDAVAAGVRITGGTVYWLENELDGGSVVEAGGRRFQERVQLLPYETAGQAWKRALSPLGARMLVTAASELLR